MEASPRFPRIPAPALVLAAAAAAFAVSSCGSTDEGFPPWVEEAERRVQELEDRADLFWRLSSAGDDMVLGGTGYTTTEYVGEDGRPFIPEGFALFPGGRARGTFLEWLEGQEIRRNLAVIETNCGSFRSSVPEPDPGLASKDEDEAIAALERRLLDQGFARVVFIHNGCFGPRVIIRDSAAARDPVPPPAAPIDPSGQYSAEPRRDPAPRAGAGGPPLDGSKALGRYQTQEAAVTPAEP